MAWLGGIMAWIMAVIAVTAMFDAFGAMWGVAKRDAATGASGWDVFVKAGSTGYSVLAARLTALLEFVPQWPLALSRRRSSL